VSLTLIVEYIIINNIIMTITCVANFSYIATLSIIIIKI
jgi:hypothetical protein